MATPPIVEVLEAISGPTTQVTSRAAIYESDGDTLWTGAGDLESRLIDGSVSVDYSRDERRSMDLSLDNYDDKLRHNPDGFWYDKIIKLYKGVKYRKQKSTDLVTNTRTNALTNPSMETASGTVVGRTNICPNPSFETDAASWTNGDQSTGTIARSTVQFERGSASLAFSSGVAYDRVTGLIAARKYTASAYVRPSQAGQYGIYGVTSPPASVESGPNRRYNFVKNGPGIFAEESTVNLVTNPAFGAGLTGWNSAGSGTAPATLDTTKAWFGTQCGKWTNSHATLTAGPNTPIVYVKPSTVYTFSAYVWVPTGSVINLATMSDSGYGNAVALSVGAARDQWQRISVTFTTGATQYTSMCYILLGPNGSSIYVDSVQLEEKPYATSYCDGSLGTGYAWNTITNILAASSGSFEDGTIGAWWVSGNCTLANSAAAAFDGTKSLAVTSIAAGTMAVGNTPNMSAGVIYTFSYWVRAATVARSVQLSVVWQDSINTALRVDSGTAITDSTTGWTRYTLTCAASPVGTVNCKLYLNVFATAGAGEVHYLDGALIEARAYVEPYGASGANNVPSTRQMNQLVFPVSMAAWQPYSAACVIKIGPGTQGVHMDLNCADSTTNLVRVNIVLATGLVSIVPFLTNIGQTQANVTLGALTVGDIISVAYTISGTTLTMYANRNGGAILSSTVTTVMPDVAKPPARLSIGYNLWTTALALCSDSAYENIFVFNAALNDTDARALVLGTLLPSAAANRADCLFSSTVNDPQTPVTLGVGGWTRLSETWMQDKNTQTDVVVLGAPSDSLAPNYLDSVLIEESDVLQGFFDGAATRIATRRNLCTNPAFGVDFTGWSNRWYGSGAGGTLVRVAGAGPNGVAVQRKTWTSAAASSADTGINFDMPVVAGKTYTFSSYMNPSKTMLGQIYVMWRNAAGGTISTTPPYTTNLLNCPAGVWTRLFNTMTAPTGAVTASFVTGPAYNSSTAMVSGDYVDMTLSLLEETDTVGSYFDGTTVATQGKLYAWNSTPHLSMSEEYCPDYTFAWVGTANASTSQQKAPALVTGGVYKSWGSIVDPIFFRSSERARVGSYSAKVVWTKGNAGSTYFGIQYPVITGHTYVLSADVFVPSGSPDIQMGAENVSTVTRYVNGVVSGGFSIKDAWVHIDIVWTSTATLTTNVYIGLVQSAVDLGAKCFYVDTAFLYEGSVPMPYFDGDTPDVNYLVNSWLGTPHASISQQQRIETISYFEDTVWEIQLGEFMIDGLGESHFPHIIKVTGRDYTKKCMLTKFLTATSFASGQSIEYLVKNIASNCGITRFILPVTGKTIGKLLTFERGTSRWQAMKEIADVGGYELYFDASGYLVMREYQDPLFAPLACELEAGEYGNLVSFEKSTNDSLIFNHILVTGASSDAQVLPVWAEAKNIEPSSPTRIARLGDRLYEYVNDSMTLQSECQNFANKFLKIHALEEYDLNFSSISYPWIEVGEIVRFIDPRPGIGDPDRFLLSSLTIPLKGGPMSGNAKRVTIVG